METQSKAVIVIVGMIFSPLTYDFQSFYTEFFSECSGSTLIVKKMNSKISEKIILEIYRNRK